MKPGKVSHQEWMEMATDQDIIQATEQKKQEFQEIADKKREQIIRLDQKRSGETPRQALRREPNK